MEIGQLKELLSGFNTFDINEILEEENFIYLQNDDGQYLFIVPFNTIVSVVDLVKLGSLPSSIKDVKIKPILINDEDGDDSVCLDLVFELDEPIKGLEFGFMGNDWEDDDHICEDCRNNLN